MPRITINDTNIDAAIERTTGIFRALSTGSRLRILLTLVEDDATVTEIVQATGLSQPLVSQHLRTLRDLRLVRVRRTGREAHYSLEDAHVMSVVQDALAHAIEDGPIR
ncbi:MAG: metalloregulator ArsR/SmtB family transcription factor [Acidipropionibacterium sp.]|jgi:DNA-binding transcriptional ArsR family regulator|nr:metalloregulator ArsR/SmtB family transcription factor [Acidipropionibacterium sp.]